MPEWTTLQTRGLQYICNTLTLSNCFFNFGHPTQTYCINHIVARSPKSRSVWRSVLFSLWNQLPSAPTRSVRLPLTGAVNVPPLGFVVLNFQMPLHSGDWDMRADCCTHEFIMISPPCSLFNISMLNCICCSISQLFNTNGPFNASQLSITSTALDGTFLPVNITASLSAPFLAYVTGLGWVTSVLWQCKRRSPFYYHFHSFSINLLILNVNTFVLMPLLKKRE